ncbi:Protein still life, isoform SIF type [Ooceraea biroi]|uniref:Protein still life, isoform SIF type n=1 Tax=Ooceraea biroi TaxID=2015173 RepID=A0A026WT50_OOCBI|nr:Protein still life, isoform SIF type [Ooceraea biroi]
MNYTLQRKYRSLERRRESKKMPKMPKVPEKVFYRILDDGSGDKTQKKKHVKFQLLGDNDEKKDIFYSDLSPVPARCASCIGESARAQWFRHSDGWQSGSSTLGSGASSSINPGYSGHRRESPWDSLPSLRHEGSLNDSGYKSNRTDSLEQRGTFDRQDSVRSDYMSDRDGRYGIVQQASLESTDSRLCYLTSSEWNKSKSWEQTAARSDSEGHLTLEDFPASSPTSENKFGGRRDYGRVTGALG